MDGYFMLYSEKIFFGIHHKAFPTIFTHLKFAMEIKNMIVLDVAIVGDIRGSFKGSMIRCFQFRCYQGLN